MAKKNDEMTKKAEMSPVQLLLIGILCVPFGLVFTFIGWIVDFSWLFTIEMLHLGFRVCILLLGIGLLLSGIGCIILAGKELIVRKLQK